MITITEEAFIFTSTDGRQDVSSFRITELVQPVRNVQSSISPQGEPTEDEQENVQSESATIAQINSLISESSNLQLRREKNKSLA